VPITNCGEVEAAEEAAKPTCEKQRGRRRHRAPRRGRSAAGACMARTVARRNARRPPWPGWLLLLPPTNHVIRAARYSRK
jgi:hypothetical protein